MMYQRLVRIATIAGCAIALAACGGGDAAVDTGAAPTPAPDPNASTASNPGAPGAAGAGATNDVDAILGQDTSGAAAGALPEQNGEDVDGIATLNVDGLFKEQATFDEQNGSMLDTAPVGDVVAGSDFAEATAPSTTETQTISVSYSGAKISLNGQTYDTTKGTVFPSDEQLFEVQSISANSAVVELVAGEFSNGSTGITLTKGKKVQLVNQDEGITYTLKLISVSTSAA